MNNFSRIAHAKIDICSPVPWQPYEDLLTKIDLPENPRILDIGCGKCGLLAKVVNATAGKGYGLDLPDSLASTLATEASDLLNESKIELILADASEYIAAYEGEGFDLIMCVGSSHALKGIHSAIPMMKRVLNPGGYVCIGELIWAKAPSLGHLQFLGCKEEDQPFAREIESSLIENGFSIIDSFSCRPEDFEQYETEFRNGVLSWCESNTIDPDSTKFKERIDSWSDARKKWGREEFGFQIYLAEI